MKIKELRKITGLTQAEFSQKYRIKKRTLENWEGGQRKTPETIEYLLERLIELENYKEKKNE